MARRGVVLWGVRQGRFVAAAGMLALLLGLAGAEAAPTNDAFGSAVVLVGGTGTVAGSNVDATRESGEPVPDPSGSGRTVWFTWEATFSGPASVDTRGSDFDTYVAVYTGTRLDRLTFVAGNDMDFWVGHARAQWNAVAGTTYRIQVDGMRGQAGAISLTWNRPRPANDDFAAAQELSGTSGAVTGSNLLATAEAGEPSGFGQGHSIWYRWTAPATTDVELDASGTEFPAYVVAYTGSSLTALAWQANNTDSSEPRLRFRATAGVTYRIELDSASFQNTGSVRLAWRTLAAPPNDAFADAQRLDAEPGTVAGDVWGATAEAGEPAHAGGEARYSVWYRWRAPATLSASVQISGNEFHCGTAVYTGSALGSLTPVVARRNNYDCSVEIPAKVGVDYAIAVNAETASGGPFNLRVHYAAPGNDAFAAARTVFGASVETGRNALATKEPGEPEHGTRPGGASVWYAWAGTVAGTVTVDTVGSTFDTLLAAYSGTGLTSLTRLASDDDGAGGGASRISFHVDGSSSFRVAVDGAGGAVGDLRTTWSFHPDPPANDAFADAQRLALEEGSVRGRTDEATKEPGEPAHAGNAGGHSVWYRWTAPADGLAIFDTFDVDTSGPSWALDTDFDTLLAVYRGTVLGALETVTANDDHGLLGRSRVRFPVSAGDEVLVAVDGANGRSGRFALNWTIAPLNDDFALPSILTGSAGSVLGTTLNSTWEQTPPERDDPANVWYLWRAPTSGPVAFTLASGTDGAGFAVWSGPTLATVESVATTFTREGRFLTRKWDAEAGAVYRIEVLGDAFGGFTLEWEPTTIPPPPVTPRPPNDDFAAAAVLTGETGTVTGTNVGATAEDAEPLHSDDHRSWGSIWYRWTAPFTGTAELDPTGSDFPTVVSVFGGERLETLSRVAFGCCATIPTRFGVTAGTTYSIAVSGVSGSTWSGNVALAWRRAASAPANDNVAAATPLTGAGGSIELSNAGASPELHEPYHANLRPAASVWFAWTAPADGPVSFSTSATSVEGRLAAYTGTTTGALNRIAANNESVAGGTEARIVFTASAGTTYRLAFDTNWTPGAASLSWRQPPAPPNDAFAAAAPVPRSWSYVNRYLLADGDNFGATTETGEPAHAGITAGATVWYRLDWDWGTTPLTVDTVGSTFDTVLAVYTGSSVSSLTRVAADDDAAGGGLSRLAFTATGTYPAATTYWIAVGGKGGETGKLTLTIGPPEQPPNDHFHAATRLSGPTGSVTGSVLRASLQDGEPTISGFGGGDGSIWYRWTAPANGTWRFDITGTAFDAKFGLFVGDHVGALFEVAGTGEAVLYAPVTAGETYSIALSGDSRSTGPAVLAWRPANVGANDAFASAEPLSGDSGSVSASNREASVEPGEPYHAGSQGGASLWYLWTAPFDGTVTFDAAGSDPADTVLAVYTGGTLRELERVAANDDFAGEAVPSVRFAAVAGTTYRIALDVVSAWPPGSERGDTTLNWVHAAPPANDRFAAAHALLGEAGEVTGATVGARTEPGEPAHGERAAGASVWYAWSAPANGTYRFDTGGSGFPALLGIYTGDAVGALEVVRRSDDLGGRETSVAFAATAGATYRIAVDGLVRATGQLSLAWSRIAPPNDAFSAPEELTGRQASVTGSTRGATREAGEPAHAGRAGTASIWYRWQAPATEPVVFDSVGSDFDTTLAVYTGGDPASLAPVAASDDADGLRTSAAAFAAREGVVYRIAIDGEESGNVVLNWRPAPFPRNDDLASARLIGGRDDQLTDTSFPATHEPGEPDHAGVGTRRSVWYRYRAPAAGRVVFRTDYVEYDTVLAAYEGTAVGALTPLAADAGTAGTYDGHRRAQLELDVVAGAEYLVAVDGAAGAGGVFTLLWSLAPANDRLAAATPIGGATGTVEGTTEGAGLEAGEPEAGFVQDHTVWYRWTAPADGTYLFDLAGSRVDDVGVGVFAGSELASLRQGGHWRDPGRVGAVGGATYVVRVASRAPPGPFRLNWRPVDAPANDNAAAARALSGDRGAVSGTNVGSSREPGEPAHGEQGYSVWFRWTAPSAGKLSAWTSGTTYDSKAVAYVGSAVATLQKVEGAYQTTCSGRCYSHFTVSVAAGTTYLLALDGVAEGSYLLNWSFDGSSPDSGTSNDAFAAAHTLAGPGGIATGTNVGATKEPGEPNHAGKAGGTSVWYAWRAPASGTTLVETTGCSLDTLIAVYTGTSLGALTTVAANDDVTGTCAASRVTFSAAAGVVYRIAVDGDGGVAGDFMLRWAGQAADTVAPSTTISAGPAGSVAARDASFSFVAEAGAAFECSLDGVSFSPCASPRAYTGLAPGAHVFRVRARDAAGNVESPAAERAWTIAAAPANDAFASAASVAGLAGEALGSVTGATKEAGEPAHADRVNDRSVWFRWTAPRDGLATVGTGQSSIWETHVGAYTGSTVASLVPVGRVSTAPSGTDTSALSFRAVAGTTYAIAVAGATNGDFRLGWRLAPANDHRRDATALVGADGTWAGDNVAASREDGEPAHAGRTGGASIWFRWTAPATGVLELDTTGSAAGLDTLLAVYTDGPFTYSWDMPHYLRAADDDSAGDRKSRIRLEVFTGITYWIAVDGFEGAVGEIVLRRSFDAEVASTPPSVALTAPADGALVRASVPLSASASDPDGIERVEFLVNGSVVGVDTVAPYTLDWDSRGVTDGPATVAARATDFSSAVATSATRTISIDNTPPETRLDSGPSGTTTATGATFAFSSTEAGASFRCALDGLWEPCSSPHSYSGLAPGRHTFQVEATDRAGNADRTPELREWEVTASDVTPPETWIDSGPPATTTATTASFTFSSEPGATFECRLDSAPYSVCTSPRAYDGLTLGAHTFSVRARDAAGNVDATPAQQTWTVEAEPPPPAPETVLDSAQTSERDATFTFSSPTTAATFECALDDAAFASCASPKTYTALPYGTHLFRVRALANGAADATPATHEWTVVEPPPPNDDFAAAEPLTGSGGTAVADNVGATSEPGEPQHAGEPGGASIWFSWTAPADGTATFDTIGSDSGLDTLLAVYTGLAVGSLTQVGADDDGGWNGKSRLVFRARAGVTYVVAVDGYLGDEGNIELAWSHVPTPANDDFGAAQALHGHSGSAAVTNVGATKEPGEPAHAGDPGGASVWFMWTAPDGGEVTLDTAGSGFDTLLAVYTGTELATLVPVAANDDDGSLPTSRVTFSVTAGTTYTIAVDGFYAGPTGPESGDVALAWALPDGSPPTVELTAPDAGASVRGEVVLTATAADAGGVRHVEFLAGGTPIATDGTPPYTTTWSSSSGADGTTTVTARAVDRAGNVATSSVSVTVDNTAPETAIDGGPTGTTSDTDATFAFSSAETGVTFSCRLDGGSWGTCTSPRSYTDLAAGGHTFAVRATDGAGNVDATPAERSWTVAGTDTTPPETAVETGPAPVTSSRSATFTFASSEPGSTFECALDTGTFAPCSSPATYADLTFGDHVFHVRASDGAGNRDPSPAAWSWRIEEGAEPPEPSLPETSIDSGPTGTVETTTAAFTFSSDDAAATFECALDAVAYAPCASPTSVGPLAAGTHTFAVRAVSAAGPDATPATRTWTISSPPPPPPPPSGGGGGGGSADLVTSISASTGAVRVGDSVVVTLRVENRGSLAQDVFVRVTTSANVTLAGSTSDRGAGCGPALPLDCSLDFLGPPGTIRLFLTVAGSGPLTVAAAARAQQTDVRPDDNHASLTIEAAAPPPPPPAPEPPAPPDRPHVVNGTSKRDDLRGSRGPDVVRGGAGADRLRGLGGNDRLAGGTGADRVYGGSGADRVYGGAGADRVYGGAGADWIHGGTGADRIDGGAGADRVHGRGGNDTISARDRRRDTITCGSGRDVVHADPVDRVARDCERVLRRRR